jgi:16S rRNA (cytidine1402-2'-O)-methyltransferase
VTGGRLSLVATPIGNLGDLSARAAEVLGQADAVACEDTRHTRKLLSAIGITVRRLLAVHEHNEAAAADGIVALLARGEHVALVTDAGTPAVSDPGQRVVAAAVAAGFPVECIPGPSALIVALAVSGLPTDRFCFEGFLPRKGPERRARLAELAPEPRTSILYEAPHRLAATVADLAAACGPDRPVSLSRELTKRFEETWRGRIGDAGAASCVQEPRGEYVLVLGGAPVATKPDPADDEDRIAAAVRRELAAGATPRDAAATVAATLGVPRRAAYAAAVAARRSV